MKTTRIIAMIGMLLALTTLTGCVLLGYNRTDNFVTTPVLSWRGGSSLRPGQEGAATGFHFVPYKGLSMHNYKVIAPVGFTSNFSFIMEFELDCRPSETVDGFWNGFFVFMVSILQVPCLGDDYTMPAACPPPTELAFMFIRNNPVEKPTEPHIAILFKGQTEVERTTSTGIIMDGMNKMYINKVGNTISIMINDRKYQEFDIDPAQGDLVTVDVTADSGHYESELPPDDEGNPRMPSDVLYFRRFLLSGTSGGSYYVPESFYFDHLNEL